MGEPGDLGSRRALLHLLVDLHLSDRLGVTASSESGRRRAVLRGARLTALSVLTQWLLNWRCGEVLNR